MIEAIKKYIIEYAHYVDYLLTVIFLGIAIVSSGWLCALFGAFSVLCLVGAILKPAKKIEKKLNKRMKL